MTEGARPASHAASDADALIGALRARGAERFDAAGLRFIEALARRAAALPAEARRLADERLARALARYRERFDRAAGEARGTLACGAARFPEEAHDLRRRCDEGDFSGLRRRLAGLEVRGGREPLAGLLAHLGARAPGDAARAAAGIGETLKSPDYFRRTWSKLSLDRRLARAFAQAPANAGPLNSHFLVLQSLGLMREISPEYLEQFVSYVDALLWLDQADGGRGPTRPGAPGRERGKKRKAARS